MFKDSVPLGRRYSIGGRTIFLGVLLWLSVECWFRFLGWFKEFLPANGVAAAYVALGLAIVAAPPIASYLFGFVFSIKHQLEADNE